MSSSRHSDTGLDRPDPADLPDARRTTTPDNASSGVGFTDEPEGYVVPLAPAGSGTSPPRMSAPSVAGARPREDDGGEPGPSLRERVAALQSRMRPWSAWTLRAKLVASMLALFTVLSLATGAFTVVALGRQLTGQVDDQLHGATSRLLSSPEIQLGVNNADPEHARGPGDEGLVAFIPASDSAPAPLAGKVTAGNRRQAALTREQLTELSVAGLGTEPRTVQLTNLGAYRVLAVPVPSSDRTVVVGALVIGLPLGPSQRTVQQMVAFVAMAVVAGVILVGLLGTWLVRRNLEPLHRVAGTAMRVSRMPLDSGQVALAERVPAQDTDVRTEVGQVGAAFNEMLDHVAEALNARHQSEQRVRQFVADASHELRTPVASIKGYAELSRREPEPMPDSVGHAMGRIESEAGRMGSLVEDLLLLARLDEGRPLESEPVDVSMLVVNAVSDAHAAAPDRQWNLDLPPEPVEVRGDQARLHQVVTNLLANARTHTPPGTRVTTSVQADDGWVRIAVHDNGPGVPAALQPNVFERFARGDDSRNRAGGSTGLGLSIVAAVTRAHGGRVELTSSPGDTTFEVVLPAH